MHKERDGLASCNLTTKKMREGTIVLLLFLLACIPEVVRVCVQ